MNKLGFLIICGLACLVIGTPIDDLLSECIDTDDASVVRKCIDDLNDCFDNDEDFDNAYDAYSCLRDVTDMSAGYERSPITHPGWGITPATIDAFIDLVQLISKRSGKIDEKYTINKTPRDNACKIAKRYKAERTITALKCN